MKRRIAACLPGYLCIGCGITAGLLAAQPLLSFAALATDNEYGPLRLASSFLFVALYSCVVLGGMGVVQSRPWGRLVAVAALCVAAALKSLIITMSLTTPGPPGRLLAYWPIYMAVLFEIILVFALLRTEQESA